MVIANSASSRVRVNAVLARWLTQRYTLINADILVELMLRSR